jgi:bacterioferritin-associated ferredoxin
MYVCVCHGITDRQICRAVDQGASCLGEVQLQLPVGGCCGRCVESAEAIIQEHRQHSMNCGCQTEASVTHPVVVEAIATAAVAV